jgi:hypothetical protein
LNPFIIYVESVANTTPVSIGHLANRCPAGGSSRRRHRDGLLLFPRLPEGGVDVGVVIDEGVGLGAPAVPFTLGALKQRKMTCKMIGHYDNTGITCYNFPHNDITYLVKLGFSSDGNFWQTGKQSSGLTYEQTAMQYSGSNFQQSN